MFRRGQTVFWIRKEKNRKGLFLKCEGVIIGPSKYNDKYFRVNIVKGLEGAGLSLTLPWVTEISTTELFIAHRRDFIASKSINQPED